MTYYEILGVSPTSEVFVIQAAYRAMMRRYHPDTNKSADAAARARQLNEAYAVLSDPGRRATYDADLKRRAEEAARRASSSGRSESATKPPPPPPPPPEDETSEIVQYEEASGWKAIAAYIGFLLVAGGIGYSVLRANAEQSSVADTMEADDVAADDIINTAEMENMADAAPPTLEAIPQGPVEFTVIEQSARRLARTLVTGGLSRARQASSDCHAKSRLEPSWQGVDSCVAFDFAAAHADEDISRQLNAPLNSYFQFQKENAGQAYEAAGAPAYSYSARLSQVKKTAESAVIEALQQEIARVRAAEERTSPSTPEESSQTADLDAGAAAAETMNSPEGERSD